MGKKSSDTLKTHSALLGPDLGSPSLPRVSASTE